MAGTSLGAVILLTSGDLLITRVWYRHCPTASEPSGRRCCGAMGKKVLDPDFAFALAPCVTLGKLLLFALCVS